MDMAKEKLSRGNVRLGLIACCIYYACIKHNSPRSIKEISCMCDIEPSVFNSAHKIFREVMKKHIPEEMFDESTQVDDLVSRFCTYLNFDRKKSCSISKKVKGINDIVDETQILIGKTPSAITASCIYYVLCRSDIEVQKKHLSTQLNVSVVTINKIVQILKNNSNLFDDLFS
jgi:transcription initiation factor TFIIIB Brf1 subunit/transcription initiation factor TFIIB